VQVAAEEQQENGAVGQQSVPRPLECSVEHGVLFSEPGQFVEDDDAG
jgi:hypothetical protein